MKKMAISNYELKVQNSKLWSIVERQREAFEAAQAEIDEDRQEADMLIEQLEAENQSLRSLLHINTDFNSQESIDKTLKLREQEYQSKQLDPSPEHHNEFLAKMIQQASLEIKKNAQDRKLAAEKALEDEKNAYGQIITQANGKRSIQPKRAFLLGGPEEGGEDAEQDGE